MNQNLEIKDETITLRVDGDLVSTNAPALRGEIDRLFEAGDGAGLAWKVCKLDLTAAAMIDSVGLNTVVGLLKRAQQRGARLQLVYSNPNVRRILSFTRLDKHLELIKPPE